ncbi:hydroxymethylglutaryl-CoA synthase family protein [Sphaerisporangium aureirubrum]|uniref:Hydroxymethylglutaryl-CoA synthase family protein n=1 Tax=Sphaerisporangium aureirubrum TaxID=1544736 RepID=A0ABW1NHV4_9ACTN
MNAGIEALNVYCGVAQIPVRTLFEGRGLDVDRMGNLMMRNRSVGLPFEDPVTNAVNAARPVVDRLDPAERDRIELLITSTESGLDYSKSVASYVHEYLGLPSTCRVVEVKQACYAATAAVQMAVAYVASGISPGAKALVIATDVALVDERGQYAEPATGAGAAAVLVSDDPRVLAVDLGAFGNHSYETMDSARPTPTFDIADSDRSLFAYLDCLSNCFEDYRTRVEGVDFATTFDYLAMHTPFAGMVKAAHRKLMREFAGTAPAQAEEDFTRRVLPSLTYPSAVGNLCSGSVYLALCSLIDHAPLDGGARVGLYSYGSGCSSEFFSGLVDQGSKRELAEMRVGDHLAGRCELAFEEYAALLPENLKCLVPEQDRRIDVEAYEGILDRARIDRDLLVNTGTKDYHRTYEWLSYE